MNVSLKQYGQFLLTYIGPQWRRALQLMVLLFANIALQLVNPQITRAFLDTAQAGGTLKTLIRIALIFLGVALAQQIISVLVAYASENVGWLTTNALRVDLVEHCLGLDMTFHKAHTPGEMIERVDGDVNALSNFFSKFVIEVLGNSLLMAGVLILLFREDWRIGLAFLGFTGLALFTMLRLRNIGVPHWAAERQANANLYGFLEERLAGTEDIRANGAKAYVLHNFFRLMREQMKTSLKAALMVNILLNTLWFLFALGTATAFAVGTYLFQDDQISIGTVYLVFQYATMLEQPLDSIVHQIQDLQKAGAGLLRVQALLNTRSTIRSNTTNQTFDEWHHGALEVAFQAVTFGYDDVQHLNSEHISDTNGKDIVLHNISFNLPPGKILGVLGRTGSGKTTMTRLLFRLYDPDSGVIYLGHATGNGNTEAVGHLADMRNVPLPILRQRVGMVTQDIHLFHATVRNNLTFFDHSVPDAQILRVIQELGLGEWFSTLPKGLDTVLESGGGGLSAGEAQLLAFTRIFLQDPGLVILDEASSRLDPATEHLIERAVDRLVQGRTAVIIAHRLGTVQRADEIMILEQGNIIEHGERAKLARDPHSKFYALLQTGMEEVLV